MDRAGRRRFLIGASALFTAITARAQGASQHRIGFITLAATQRTEPGYLFWRELETALGQLGYREGSNLRIWRSHAGGNPERLNQAASELVRAAVEVIVAVGSQYVKAAREVTRTVPIVSYTADPVVLGFAESFARPGGNVTGVSPSTTDLSPKQLEFLAMAVPGLRRVAWLRNPNNPYFSQSFEERLNASARLLGLHVSPMDLAKADAVEATVAEVKLKGFDGVLVPSDAFFVRLRDPLGAALLGQALPSATLDGIMLDAGLLLTYGVDFTDGVRRMASQIDKIFKGASAANIPIEIIERFALGVNLRTARALKLTVPQSLLLRADRVIE